MRPVEPTHKQLREIWAIVSENPGISIREIGRRLKIPHSQIRKFVGTMLEVGTLVATAGKRATLRATVPLITLNAYRNSE